MKTFYHQLYFSNQKEDINNILNNILITSPNIIKIGITAPPKTKIKLNNNDIEIGMNGILEIKDTKIEFLQFLLPINNSNPIYIDYMTSQEEDE